MKLDEVTAAVAEQLRQQSELGVKIDIISDVPEIGPSHGGWWQQIPDVTAVFADLKSSTSLNTEKGAKTAAFAYTYFIRAMTAALDNFSADYIDIHGDGIFGLFSQKSQFPAIACAITMKTIVETNVSALFKQDASSNWELTAGIGIDQGTVLVRQLGLKGAKQNEVWAGKPLNVAAKLSSVAKPNELVVSERAFAKYIGASELRQKAIIRNCGCGESNLRKGSTRKLWLKQQISRRRLGLDFDMTYRRKANWCLHHGAEFCEAIITGRRPD